MSMLTIDIDKLAAAAADSVIVSVRNKRAAVNEVIDHYPELRDSLARVIGEDTKTLNKQYKAIELIAGFDARNGNVLASYDLQPEEIWRFGKDRFNSHIAKLGYKVVRGKYTELQLEHKPGSDAE